MKKKIIMMLLIAILAISYVTAYRFDFFRRRMCNNNQITFEKTYQNPTHHDSYVIWASVKYTSSTKKIIVKQQLTDECNGFTVYANGNWIYENNEYFAKKTTHYIPIRGYDPRRTLKIEIVPFNPSCEVIINSVQIQESMYGFCFYF